LKYRDASGYQSIEGEILSFIINNCVSCQVSSTFLLRILFLKSTYCEYILEKILSTSEVGPILALIAPSPLSVTCDRSGVFSGFLRQ
jgi:hypothetical protein